MHITCFLPCRKGSERIKKKNIRPFGGYKHGLLEIKLLQLSRVQRIQKIILSTNDKAILDFAGSLKIKNLEIQEREELLCGSSTSTDSLIQHVINIVRDGSILWTHVTSPFLSSSRYSEIIAAYENCLENGYDSLMTTTEIKGFIWNKNGPVSYDRGLEKWPRTQTIEPLHEINSGAFICSADVCRKYKDRIGVHPKLYPLSKFEGFDIDWPEDFKIGECLLREGLASI